MGHVGIVLPMLLVMMMVSILALPFGIIGLLVPLLRAVGKASLTHQVIPTVHISFFYLNMSVISLLSFITIGILVLTIFIGKKRLLKKNFWSLDLATMIVYPFFAGWWAAQSTYNALRGKKGAWR